MIPKDALDQIQVVMQQHGRGLALRLLPHIEPEVVEEVHIAAQFLFGLVFRGRAADEPAGNALAMGLHHFLQPLTLLFRRNLARHTGVVYRRHVNNEPARQRDMRRNPRTLLPQRFLGDLNDNFLAFLEQVGDRRQRGSLALRPFASFRTFASRSGRSLRSGRSPRSGRSRSFGAFAAIPAAALSALRTAFLARLHRTLRAGFARSRVPSACLGRGGHIAVHGGKRCTSLALPVLRWPSAHFSPHPPRNPMRIAMALLAESRSQAGRDACRFGAFLNIYRWRGFGSHGFAGLALRLFLIGLVVSRFRLKRKCLFDQDRRKRLGNFGLRFDFRFHIRSRGRVLRRNRRFRCFVSDAFLGSAFLGKAFLSNGVVSDRRVSDRF